MTILHHPRARRIGACTLAIVAIGLTGSAMAQSDDSGAPRSVRVSYADLDLGSRAGAAEAFARIRSAAGQVCDSGADIRMLERQAQYAQCRSEAVARAVDTLHAPLVASMAGRTNTSLVAGR